MVSSSFAGSPSSPVRGSSSAIGCLSFGTCTRSRARGPTAVVRRRLVFRPAVIGYGAVGPSAGLATVEFARVRFAIFVLPLPCSSGVGKSRVSMSAASYHFLLQANCVDPFSMHNSSRALGGHFRGNRGWRLPHVGSLRDPTDRFDLSHRTLGFFFEGGGIILLGPLVLRRFHLAGLEQEFLLFQFLRPAFEQVFLYRHDLLHIFQCVDEFKQLGEEENIQPFRASQKVPDCPGGFQSLLGSLLFGHPAFGAIGTHC